MNHVKIRAFFANYRVGEIVSEAILTKAGIKDKILEFYLNEGILEYTGRKIILGYKKYIIRKKPTGI